MVTAALLLSSFAHGADVKVTHLDHFRVYRMEPGDVIKDVWPAIVTEPTRRGKRNPHVVSTELRLTSHGEGLQLVANVEDVVGDKVVDFHRPTLTLDDAKHPNAEYLIFSTAMDATLVRVASGVEVLPEIHDESLVVRP